MTTNIASDRSFFDDHTEYFQPDDPRWTSLKDVRKRETQQDRQTDRLTGSHLYIQMCMHTDMQTGM